MLIEDSAGDARLIQEMLVEKQFISTDIERFSRLSEGIKRLTARGIDVILLDLGLPDSQGLKTFEKIHSTAPQLPVIILTGFEDDALALVAVQQGAQDYLVKGKFDSDLLRRSIVYAVERKRSEEKYRTLFDSIDEGFCIVEMIFDADNKPIDYRFLEVNSSFERQTGMHDAQGKLMRSFAPNHEEHWFQIYGEIAITGKPRRFVNEAKALNRWYDVYAFPVGTEKPWKVGILFNDISERIDLEKQVQNSERLAAIGATAGMVGHDIRNPLQAIIGDLYLTRQDLSALPESEEKTSLRENLEAIEENVDYINKIIVDLQDYARPLDPVSKEVNLEPLLKAALENKNTPKNIQASYHIEENVRVLFTDPDLLKRILNNLGTNAIQAMPNGGKLFVEVYKDKEGVTITIEDTGIGIPDEIKPKLFTPMVTTKSKGQGFGLAVVKRLTEALGGTVTFESEVGKGTKFIVHLPLSTKIDDKKIFK